MSDTSTVTVSPACQLFDELRRSIPRNHVFAQTASALTYGELFAWIERMAAVFESLGVSQGDRVLIATSDRIATATIVLSAIRCGIAAIPINDESGPAEFRALSQKADVSAVFADKPLLDKFDLPEGIPSVAVVPPAKPSLFERFRKKQTPGSNFIPFLDHPSDDLPEPHLPESIDIEQTAYILFTSGTTSEPKGVEISHRNLFANVSTLQTVYNFNRDTRLLNILPLHHTDGLTQGPVLMFFVGGMWCYPMEFDLNALGQLLDSVYRWQLTHWITAPTVLSLANEFGSDFSDALAGAEFEFVISTAGYLPEATWTRFEEMFETTVVNVYGLTETVCEATYCGPDPSTRRVGSVGKPIDVEAAIIDDNGAPVDDGRTGELHLRGDNIMKGYFQMPESTRAVLSEDGWLATGDLARFDSDGFLYIVGRKKDVIITGGINVYPEDVASLIREIPGVINVAVIGLPDDRWGEVVAACVQVTPEAQLTPENVREEIRRIASSDLVPQKLRIVHELPLGPSGKVIKSRVAEMFAPSSSQDSVDGDLGSRVYAVAGRAFDADPSELSADSNRENVAGWSSLAHVELILSIEQEFGFKMETRDVMTLTSLRDVLAIVDRNVNGSR